MSEVIIKEHPILFKTEMVQAILDGRKTQTRRIIKPQPKYDWLGYMMDYEKTGAIQCGEDYPDTDKDFVKFPYGKVGDRLWVKESALYPPDITEQMIIEGADTWPKVVYSEGNVNINELKDWGWKQKPSIFMPRWASRITLEITDIKPQELQDITEDESISEGVTPLPEQWDSCYLDAYIRLWDSINKKRGYGWDKNPWVWVISFKILEATQ